MVNSINDDYSAMKNTKSMISTIYETLHAADLDELEVIYKNWASDYEHDVIHLAGYVGHLITTDLLLNYLENKKALEINEISKDRLYDKFLTNLIMNSGGTSSMQDSGMMELLLQIKNSKPTGRIIAEFDLDIISSDPSKDTILEDGDKIYIPQLTQQVLGCNYCIILILQLL